MTNEKEKDPSFLMYSKDWLEGTADMMPDEKGVYIDLLCHQHQKGTLPADTSRLARLVGLPEDKFLLIWEHLRHKFSPINGTKLANQKLIKVTTERVTYSLKKKIAGEFAYLLRQSAYTEDVKYKIKKEFKMDDFIGIDPENVREKLVGWLSKW